MSNQKDDKQTGKEKKDAPLKPDAETLHKTDPQDNMKGPISSLVQTVKEGVEEDDNESKEEADKKKKKNM
ncbi:MAG: hypothetical protein ACXWWC_11180 [Chitinophagaceae bacterium]